MIAAGNPPDFIRAGYQTAGRGQAGNGWESEADKNLLCSILLPPRETLFELNMIVAVAVCRTAQAVLQRSGLSSVSEAVSIKWPNDIYWQDKKVAGILVENAIIGGEVKYSIAGIGLNVNQTEWHSDAPNPVSLRQITGREYDLDELMQRVQKEIQEGLRDTGDGLWDFYKTHLYRREGYWPYVEREVTTAPTMNADRDAKGAFLAKIEDILPTGEIVLRDKKEQQRIYHFKQIRYVL